MPHTASTIGAPGIAGLPPQRPRYAWPPNGPDGTECRG
ncbi:MAG: hypothetical protein JWQ95_1938 [Sphaerisporangium sp.]|jgi:hypothetical protein|nr:hypothetical protein [Sphaerisporangium sp.]